jgi:hypothetical protein
MDRRNAHEDRREGAVRLRKKLNSIIRQSPDASVFIVAHSHGGNVALRAICRSSYLKEQISGVICIATPFLKFSSAKLTLALLPTILMSAASWAWSWLPAYVAALVVTLPLFLLISFFKWLLGLPWLFPNPLSTEFCTEYFSVDECHRGLRSMLVPALVVVPSSLLDIPPELSVRAAPWCLNVPGACFGRRDDVYFVAFLIPSLTSA